MGDRSTSVHRIRGRTLLGAVTAAAVLEFVSNYLNETDAAGELVIESFSVAAFLCFFGAGAYAVRQLSQLRYIRTLMIIAFGLVALTQVLDLIDGIVGYENLTVYSPRGTLFRIIESSAYLIGLIIMIVACYASVLMTQKDRERVEGERVRLAEEVERRSRAEAALLESEEKFRTLVNSFPYAVALIQDGRIVFANPAAATMVGLDAPSLIGQDPRPFIHERDRETSWQYMSVDVFQERDTRAGLERTFLRRDGTAFPVELHVSPVLYQGNIATQLVAIDISSRKADQDALAASEEKYRTILQSIEEGYYEVDISGRLTFFNQALCRILGYDHDELDGMSYTAYYGGGTPLSVVESTFMGVLETGESVQVLDWQATRKDGREIMLEVSISLIRNAGGKPVGFRGIARDVTERSAQERLLRETENRTRALVEANPDNLLRLRDDGEILYFKPDMGSFPNLTADDVIVGTNVSQWLEEDQKEQLLAGVRKAIESDSIETVEFTVLDAGRTLDLEARIVRSGDCEVVAVVRDITERKESERALRDSEERYRTLIETMNEGMGIIDENEIIIYVNDKMCAMGAFRREDLLGHDIKEFIADEHRDLLINQLRLRKRALRESYEVNWMAPDGSRIPTLMSPRPLFDHEGNFRGSFSVITDLTELKHLQERVTRAEKMESLGRLAGGVAHDLNNILSGVVSYPDVLLAELPIESPLRQPLATIKKAGERAAGIVDDLLTLTRRGVPLSTPVSLNQIVQDYIESPEFKQLCRENPDVRLQYELEPTIQNVIGSPVHLSKSLMNLVTNAMEAMPHGGNLTIRTATDSFSEPLMDGSTCVSRCAMLQVTDTGTGMSEEDKMRVFEPFYTRKVMGRSGTGLGLTVVWNTVNDHNGQISVESAEGEGTTFRLFFPAAPTQSPRMHASSGPARGNLERILVVDDVPEQREIACKMLNALNYTAESAASGEEALERIRDREWDLVLLDMIMDPGIDGLETFRRIVAMRPAQKAVIASGYAETDRVREAERLGVSAYLKKPYSMKELAEIVNLTLTDGRERVAG